MGETLAGNREERGKGLLFRPLREADLRKLGFFSQVRVGPPSFGRGTNTMTASAARLRFRSYFGVKHRGLDPIEGC